VILEISAQRVLIPTKCCEFYHCKHPIYRLNKCRTRTEVASSILAHCSGFQSNERMRSNSGQREDQIILTTKESEVELSGRGSDNVATLRETDRDSHAHPHPRALAPHCIRTHTLMSHTSCTSPRTPPCRPKSRALTTRSTGTYAPGSPGDDQLSTCAMGTITREWGQTMLRGWV
jgi:hypothetical protein